MASAVSGYVLALLSWWLVTLLAIEGFVALVSRLTKREIPQRVFLLIAWAAILVAGFDAWRVKNSEAEDWRTKATTAAQEVARLQGEKGAREDQIASLRTEVASLRSQVASLGPRRVTPEQMEVLRQRLRALPPFHVLEITTLSGSDDATHFAEDILQALRGAGWIMPERSGHSIFVGAGPEGIVLRIGAASPHIDAIVAAFNAAGMGKGAVMRDANLKPDQVQLTVGHRPR